MKKTVLRSYAKLIARSGVAIRKNDIVIINAGLDQPEFINMVVEECYRAGAEKVLVDWSYAPVQKTGIKFMKPKALGRVENFEEAKLKFRLEKNPAMIYIISDDPNGFKGIDQKKYANAMKEKLKVIKPYRDQMDNKYKWCIAAAPGKEWAKVVFPGMRTSTAVEKLWEAILYTSRVIDKDGNLLDPVAEWDKHNASFAEKCRVLNEAELVALEYKSSNGTDLTVGLMEQGSFLGGGEYTLGTHEYFNPNIPTEEVFTTPKAGVCEGIVYSSLPLSYNGEIIDNFSMKFEGGKIVEVKAEKNEALLREMVGMDEGAAMLGECALVPYDSPIRNSGIMFFETLFDENASCHFAIGRGFTNTVKNYSEYTNEQMKEMGVNDSSIHVDFMIGTADMSIVGIKKNGERFQIFKDGNWAF
ncbi:MAG: aminopeptidase [Ruminococcaceae bacterium]|nr:aminopeptidase [Oscillospiraceae bacterium]